MTTRWLLTVAVGALAGCTTLGGTVRGDFTCRAAQGTCAPLSVNDAGSVAALTQDRAAPAGLERIMTGGAVRSGERLLSVLLPAHVDADGVLHDAATVHVVAEPARWRPAIAAHDQRPSTPSARSLSPSLREVISGAWAPAMEGLEVLPTRAPQPLPSADALDAARAGHRIRKPLLSELLGKPSAATAKGAAQPVRPMTAPPLAAPTSDRESR